MTKNCHLQKLGEVIKLEYGKPLDKTRREITGLYPVYGANGEKARSNEYYYDKESIIVGRKGSAGEINITTEKFWPLDVTYFVTFNDRKYNLKFLFHLLSTLNLPKLAKGVKPGINRNDVYSLDVLIPPLPEQKRIVKILDKAFAAIDKTKANAEKNLQNSRELFDSYLNKVFANPGEDWEEKKLGEMAVKIGSGATPRGGKKSYKETGISLIRSLNVYDREFRKKDLALIDKEQARKLSNVTLCEGDVLLNITGASVARCCIVPSEYLPARVNQHVSIIRLKDNTISPKLLNYLLTSKVYKDKLLQTGEKGGAVQHDKQLQKHK